MIINADTLLLRCSDSCRDKHLEFLDINEVIARTEYEEGRVETFGSYFQDTPIDSEKVKGWLKNKQSKGRYIFLDELELYLHSNCRNRTRRQLGTDNWEQDVYTW